MRKLLLGAIVALAPMGASASAIITDGNVSLGVNDLGNLNVAGGVADVVGTTDVGVRWLDGTGAEYESTSHGCSCEGWGLAVDGVSGFANNSAGTAGLTSISFGATATTATSVVGIDTTGVTVTHDFKLSASSDLYEVVVTITNGGLTDVADLEYRRTMDWDTSPTPFSEFVTIGGTATTADLLEFSDNGFSSADPLEADLFDLAGCGTAADFTACGPDDHGAVFDFALGGLLAGESRTFSIFYGGAEDKAAADAALGAVGAELYSYGWSCEDTNQDGVADTECGYGGPIGRTTPTFIFAFKGVGGVIVVPPPAIPVPAAVWLMLGGLGALGGLRRLRRAA